MGLTIRRLALGLVWGFAAAVGGCSPDNAVDSPTRDASSPDSGSGAGGGAGTGAGGEGGGGSGGAGGEGGNGSGGIGGRGGSSGTPDASTGSLDAARPDSGTSVPDAAVGPDLGVDRPSPDAPTPDAPPPTGGQPSIPAGCNNPSPSAWNADWANREASVLRILNGLRAKGTTCRGNPMPAVEALSMQAHLQVAARCHSMDMGKKNYFSHDSPDGRKFSDRIRETGYPVTGTIGENIARSQATPEAVVNAWHTSTSGHCENMMSSAFTEIGVGYYPTGAKNGHFWTQDFAGR